MGQNQPRDVTFLVVLAYPILNTMFQSYRSIGSGDDFLSFLPHMGVAAILVM